MLGMWTCFGLPTLVSLETRKLLDVSQYYSLFILFLLFVIGNENRQTSTTGVRYRDSAKSQGNTENTVF